MPATELEAIHCAGCGGLTALAPCWDPWDPPLQPWTGSLLIMRVDGSARFVHHQADCLMAARLPDEPARSA